MNPRMKRTALNSRVNRVDGIEPPNSNLDGLPGDLLGRLENLYPKLAPSLTAPLDESLIGFGAPILEIPTVDALSSCVARCSFKIFSDPAGYYQSPRAKEFVSWSAPRSDAYRVYFNAHSGKVYVDLNGKRWAEVRSKLEQEHLYCEILRTLIFVLTCEVEIAEARKAEENSQAVTSEVTEVIIPSS